MNILPKKRWHVRNRDNKERVRKDEENAKQEQLKEEERIALAEQEARMRYLRKKNNIPMIKESSEMSALAKKEEEKPKNINLFEAEEKNGCSLVSSNVDYMKEKKLEKESYEKKIGLLTYVGQSSIEAQNKNEQPWYLEKPTGSQENNVSIDELRKDKLDPLTTVHKHLKVKKEKKSSKKKKKDKDSEKSSSSKKTIAQMREDRLKIEKHERERANKLLSGQSLETDAIEENPQRYNNQFNPSFVRKKYNDRHKPY